MRVKLGFNVINSKKIPFGRYTYIKDSKNKQHTIIINKRLFTTKNINKFLDVAYHEYTHYILNLMLRKKVMIWNEQSLTEPICQLVEKNVQNVYKYITGRKK